MHFCLYTENHEHAVLCAEVIFDFFENDADTVAHFLNSSLNINNSLSPLHRAAVHGNHGLIELYISRGANALQTDNTNSNVLHLAVDNGTQI